MLPSICHIRDNTKIFNYFTIAIGQYGCLLMKTFRMHACRDRQTEKESRSLFLGAKDNLDKNIISVSHTIIERVPVPMLYHLPKYHWQTDWKKILLANNLGENIIGQYTAR